MSQLIREVVEDKNQPVTIMIDDDDIINMPIYNILWSALGTLSIARLIKIFTYQWYYFQIIFEDFSKPSNQFLSGLMQNDTNWVY